MRSTQWSVPRLILILELNIYALIMIVEYGHIFYSNISIKFIVFGEAISLKSPQSSRIFNQLNDWHMSIQIFIQIYICWCSLQKLSSISRAWVDVNSYIHLRVCTKKSIITMYIIHTNFSPWFLYFCQRRQS